MNINYYIVPSRYKRIRREFGERPIRLLDIGLAAKSVALAKRWLPNCKYYGLDITDAHVPAAERGRMEALIQADLETDSLDQVEDGFFDAIVMSHVLEHLMNGLPALERLCTKLAPGGRFYIEFPSYRSLGLPEARHTLNFSDDPTHVRIYSIQEVANTVMRGGLRVIRAGRRREWPRILLCAFTFPIQILTYFREGRLHGIGLWDLLGFADFVYARRPGDAS